MLTTTLLIWAVVAAALIAVGLAVAHWYRARTAENDLARIALSLDSLELERAQIQREQTDLLSLLRELPQLTETSETSRRLRDIPQMVHRVVLRIFEPREAMVLLRRRPTSDQPERGSQLIVSAATPGAPYRPGAVVEIGEGAIGRLAQCVGPAWRDEIELGGSDSSVDLGTPMMQGDELMGVIALSGLPRKRFYDRDILWLLAGLGGYALASHRQLSRVKSIADLDPLTEIYNKGALARRLTKSLRQAEAGGEELSVFMFDVDQFKAYNDRNGHLAGDELLRQLALFVSERIRSEDVFGRFGGEEFLLILPGRSPADAAAAAESIRRDIAQRDFLFGERQPMKRITISGGVATFPTDANDGTELLENADAALYGAKQAGRNRVGIAAPSGPRTLTVAAG